MTYSSAMKYRPWKTTTGTRPFLALEARAPMDMGDGVTG